MLDILQYTFMQRAVMAGAIVGVLCSVVGIYVILRGMSFIGAGISHASFGGVALGFLLGINPIITAIVFCLVTAFGIGFVARRSEIKEDTAVGIFFSATMALGILFISITKGYNVDLFGYLFGSILAVTDSDIVIILITGLVILALIYMFYKELLCISFDQEMASVIGLPSEKLYFLLLGIIALTIVISIKIVGIILVSALIITPAATAFQLTEDFRKMVLISIITGVFSSIGGLLLSFYFNTASGATIVLLSTMIFFASAIFSPRRSKRNEAYDRI